MNMYSFWPIAGNQLVAAMLLLLFFNETLTSLYEHLSLKKKNLPIPVEDPSFHFELVLQMLSPQPLCCQG